MENDLIKPKLLLHTCCATCSGFLAENLKDEFRVTIFYDNSNIFPLAEYQKRRDEAEKFFKEEGLFFVESEYDHLKWLELVKGMENEKEKGRRCLVCYRSRLENTANYAIQNGYNFFSTTLTISPHKSAKDIIEIGERLSEERGVGFLAKDWKKNDGFKKAMEFSCNHIFYRQNYCGCEFSIRS